MASSSNLERQAKSYRLDRLEGAIHRHYAESLFLAACLAEFVETRELVVGDVGYGAGFPGVPIAVSRPDWRVTLIESHRRNAVFLAQASRQLSNLAVVPSRFEDVTGNLNVIVSRAVAWPEISGGPSHSELRRFCLLVRTTSPPIWVLKVSDWDESVPVPSLGRGFVLVASLQSST